MILILIASIAILASLVAALFFSSSSPSLEALAWYQHWYPYELLAKRFLAHLSSDHYIVEEAYDEVYQRAITAYAAGTPLDSHQVIDACRAAMCKVQRREDVIADCIRNYVPIEDRIDEIREVCAPHCA